VAPRLLSSSGRGCLTEVMAASFDHWLPDLRCPLTLLRESREVTLKRQDGMLVSASGSRYPLYGEIPDLRPLAESKPRSESENYAFIHDRQSTAEARPSESTLSRMCVSYGVDRAMVEGKRVLVAGAALGTEVEMMCFAGARIVDAIDYAEHVRALPNQINAYQSEVHFAQADVQALPFASRFFDIVFSSGVLMHTRSPELGFRELYRVVKPGGHIVLSMTYPENALQRSVTRSRLKYAFHRMPAETAEKKLRGKLRRRMILEKLRLARLDYALTGLFFPGHGLDKATRLGMALDTYYSPYRFSLDFNEIRQWFLELGMSPHLPSNFAPYFRGVAETDFGSRKSFLAKRPEH
jgi:SAM-dependent methyltransferase